MILYIIYMYVCTLIINTVYALYAYIHIHTLLHSQSQYLAANLTPNAEIAVF